jgi:hypothetical protein
MNEVNATEDRLRSEIEALKRQLEEQKHLHAPGHRPNRRPSTISLVLIALLLAALIVVGFFVGYLPRQRREAVLAAESKESVATLPVVNVSRVTRSSGNSQLVLPGNIQAVTEAPILARATGYIRKRYVDIGDRVKAGQVVAEVEAPELDQQILQANANRVARMKIWRASPPGGWQTYWAAESSPNRITTTRRRSTPRSRPMLKRSTKPPPPCAARSPPPRPISPG